MKRGKRIRGKTEARIFHYTVVENYNKIVRDRFIRPATEGVPVGERPAVWFSIHPVWEPTATKGLRDRKTGEMHLATWAEMQEFGPVRIEVPLTAAPYRWTDYLRLSGASRATARGLDRTARACGANVIQWRISFDPVPVAKWLAVELWSGTDWRPIRTSDCAPALDDPRFAFIAKTEEEWVAFRDSDIVVARDATTGRLSVVFGQEKVREARAKADKEVRALVVKFNPTTDELERLAAACVVLMGRHDLEPQGTG